MKITKAEYIFEEEQDDNGRPIHKNPAFGSAIELCTEFYKKTIFEKDFLNLYWCPKASGNNLDEIDKITNGTRKIKDIVTFLKYNTFLSDKPTLKTYFMDTIEPTIDKRRFFLIEVNGKKEIRDGLHRAGAIMRLLSKGSSFGQGVIYLAKLK